jgi:hypothetical protein
MISAVARIMRPGAKVDHMLILEGPHGAKKSSALEVLAGEPWFTDELAEIGSKDAAQQMRGIWIIEIAERASRRSSPVQPIAIVRPTNATSSRSRVNAGSLAASIRIPTSATRPATCAPALRQHRPRRLAPRSRASVGGSRGALSGRSDLVA